MDNYIKSLYFLVYMYVLKFYLKSELYVCILMILMGVNLFVSVNLLLFDILNCLIIVYYIIRVFKIVKNIQYVFFLCNVVRVEEYVGGGGGEGGGGEGLLDNIC